MAPLHPRRKKNPSLAAALARSGHTGKSLARSVGIHPTNVSRILNNRQAPSPANAAKMAAILQTPVSELFPESTGKEVCHG